MYHKTRWSHVLVAAAAGWLLVGLAAQGVAQEIQDWSQNDGAEVLTRGPLHEAFAEVVRYDPEPGLTVSPKPPQPIEEVPPEEKPEGEGYEWIGGYWGWDEDREDFVWISGVWRIPPPGTQWVPGYWAEVAGGWQWVSGYWAPLAGADQQQVEYLPQPPASLEAGPSSPAPTDDYFWVPGCWLWHQGRYVWRAGYWALARASWVWIPARYVWTPGGCVYVPGHWDYTLLERGLSFCPVYFRRPIYLHVGFRFTPSVVIYGDVLHRHLFCRPLYGHYYFGDYYASSYVGIGIYPWFIFYHSRYAYEPFYTYHRWYFHDREPDWHDRVHRWYRYHRDHHDARPPHTFADFRRMGDSHHGDRGPHHRLAVSLKGNRDREHFPVRLERISHDRHRTMTDHGNRVHQLADHRAEIERGLRAKSGHGPAHGPLRATLPESAVRREAGPAALGRHGPPPARLDERGGVGRLGAGHDFTHRAPDPSVRSELPERLRNRDNDEGRTRFEPPQRLVRPPSSDNPPRVQHPDTGGRHREGGTPAGPTIPSMRERFERPNLPERLHVPERTERGGSSSPPTIPRFHQRSERPNVPQRTERAGPPSLPTVPSFRQRSERPNVPQRTERAGPPSLPTVPSFRQRSERPNVPQRTERAGPPSLPTVPSFRQRSESPHVPSFRQHRSASPPSPPSRSVVPRSVPQFREHSRSHGRSSDSGPRFSPPRSGGSRSHGSFSRGHGRDRDR